MKPSSFLHQPHPFPFPILILFFFFSSFLILPILSTSSPAQCIPSVPTLTSPYVFPRATLPAFYSQRPSTKQSPSAILERLESESQIRDKLALYALVVDGKNYSALADIFVPNTEVYFDSSVGLIRGLDSFGQALKNATAKVDSQILQGSYLIKVYEENPCTASSFTYFLVTYHGTGAVKGKSVIIEGDYRDRWVETEPGNWKIVYRIVTFIGDPIGDLQINPDGTTE